MELDILMIVFIWYEFMGRYNKIENLCCSCNFYSPYRCYFPMNLFIIMALFYTFKSPTRTFVLIIEDDDGCRVDGARVVLRPLNSKKIYICKSSCEGILSIKDLKDDIYVITIEKKEYENATFIINLHNNIACYSVLQKKSTLIQGYISDSDGYKLRHAIVILYMIRNKEDLIPYRYTYTDFLGQYSFINVPKGDYLIKAIK